MENAVLLDLRRQVLAKLYKHEFDSAASLLASLFVLPANKKHIDFQSGRVVAHTFYHDDQYKLLQFYSDSARIKSATTTKRSILYETALCAIANSKFGEAAQAIKHAPSQINKAAQTTIPRESGLYQGMLGIIYFLQWEENQTNESHDAALGHLVKAIELDPSCHIFILYYCKLLLADQEVDKMITLLTDFRTNNKSNPLAHRMLGWVMLKYHSADSASDKFEMMVDCFRKEFQLDQCSELAFQVLVNVYFNHPGHIEDHEIFSIICVHLDYITDNEQGEEPFQWEILWNILQKVELKTVQTFMKGNPRWLLHHFSIQDNSSEGEFKSRCKDFLEKMI